MTVTVGTAPFWARLSAYGERPALITTDETLSYTELARRVTALSAALGTTRRLVAIEGGNTVETVVAYLAALAGGHPVILTPSADAVAAYDADVMISGGQVAERREGTAHDLHPELALLLTTSGSSGSPKLVRLSHTNLTSNAAAIASYLQIRPTDVAPTSLPLHYCYGLSVLNSHLSVGAAVLLTGRSVTEPGFWEDFRAHGCTTLAGVPYTFDLLDRVGFESLDLPSLRYLTQAGGRLDPVTVRRYAELGQQRGFDLFVMYGQTEATARMAYLPPDLTLSCPGAVGVPVPGGSFRLDDGELVYRGDNVMLGYARGPADLAHGREIHELRTGDLARKRPDGLYEITGRVSRFAKVFGLRIDLDHVERTLAADGVLVHCADGGDRVVVAVDVSARPAPADLTERAAAAAGVPTVEVLQLTEIPRLASGKVDYQAIRAGVSTGSAGRPTGEALEALYARILRRDVVTPDDTFVSLKGDSLSYVEMSLRLEETLGTLPADWPTMPIRELATLRRKRRWGRSLETNVLLRAMAIVAIVGSHSNLFTLMGGAHVLIGLVGYNFARFQLTDASRRDRARRILASVGRVVVPSVLWLTFAAIASWKYGVLNVLLLNGLLGSHRWTESWHYWFVEMLVYTLLAMAAFLSIPRIDRLERQWSFWFPMALAVLALLTRYGVISFMPGDRLHRAHIVFWLFALGWAAAKATSPRHRVLVSLMLVVTVPGFFHADRPREAVLLVGMLVLVWSRSVRVPRVVGHVVGVLASASLYIYLCHWQVYPYWENTHPLAATLLSLSAGVVFWFLATRAARHLQGMRDTGRWLSLRRYVTSESRHRAEAASRRDDQPAHVTA